jgi:hypothetical protein
MYQQIDFFYPLSPRILIDCNIDYNMQREKTRWVKEGEVKLI